ncbi:hypothetical protein SAMN04488109_5170 [Chryseolinea serpens]|uniref:Uncharacterized protein n=1 Tax=Chryseolinea serpens TaxID=947013 RepID=A0A1M5VK62_9BACT|nr:hypothetical protein [Chryseolinea serpens]SHH75621.1 hypothetical protein SAMN04488109_5170 [Chryseolinea serpens]
MNESSGKGYQIADKDEPKVLVRLLEIPVFLSGKKIHRLNDFAYGEWLIFEGGRPKYYFCILDERYADKKDQITQSGDVERYLEKSFKDKGLNLSLKNGVFGWALEWKFEIIDLYLENLPLEYL